MGILACFPHDQTFWSLRHDNAELPRLTRDCSADVVVIGGGMAGLAAAQACSDKGLSVILVEKSYCGAGATGKSSGFITPDSELSLANLIDLYGADNAQQLWELVLQGVTLIRKNVHEYGFECDYTEYDTLVVANTLSDFESDIQQEYNARRSLGYHATLYSRDTVPTIIGSSCYSGGIRYDGSFSINGFLYCQGMKKVLREQGVTLYEETPALTIGPHLVETSAARIKAEYVIVCVDQYGESLPALRDILYHAQTFLLLSAPLSDAQIKTIFPEKPCMVWDTALVYTYYRLTYDNRLLVGGARLWDTYRTSEYHNNRPIIRKLSGYIRDHFPALSCSFEYCWPGLIGISKDLFPLAGRGSQASSIYYVTATAGLPWAATLGYSSISHILDNRLPCQDLFSLTRPFALGAVTQRFLGKRLTFALSNFLTIGSI